MKRPGRTWALVAATLLALMAGAWGLMYVTVYMNAD